jgi:predicted component of type VI protein secretion system
MKKAELLKTLAALHQDLSAAEQVDPEAERLLRAVTNDIERLLNDQQEARQEDSKTLSSKLQSLVLSWEADHPQIARLIGQAADTLANIGI